MWLWLMKILMYLILANGRPILCGNGATCWPNLHQSQVTNGSIWRPNFDICTKERNLALHVVPSGDQFFNQQDINSSYGLKTMGPLCPWQCFFYFYRIFIEYQNVILATILGELVRMKFSLWNINCPPGWKGGGEVWLLLEGPNWERNIEIWWGDGGGVGEEEEEEGEGEGGGGGGDGGGGGGKPLLRICAWKSK